MRPVTQTFIACSPSEAEINDILEWTRSINERTKAIFETSYEPYVFEDAYGLASFIEIEAGLVFTQEQKNILNEALSFSLAHGVLEEDIISAASDIALRAQDGDDLVYSLRTVLCLKVADKLDQKNVAQWGSPISPVFHDIAVEVEDAIRSGNVTVEKGAVEGQDRYQLALTGSGFVGEYRYDQDRLMYQHIQGQDSLYDMLDRYWMAFSYILHESVHVYEDIHGLDNNYFESEIAAHEIGAKAQVLLAQSIDTPFFEPELSSLAQERGGLEELKVENILYGLYCMGYGDAFQNFEHEYWLMKEDVMSAWTKELQWGLAGYDDLLARDLYSELLTVRHAYVLMWRAMRFGERYYENDQFDALNVNVVRDRRLFNRTDHESHDGAMAAQYYIFSLGASMVHARYTDAALFQELQAEYLRKFDTVAQALLYQTYDRDGVMQATP
jgi:hypothetical protein